MSDHSKIEWTDATWNPIRGCTRVSEGCRNCYAEKVAARFSGPGKPFEGIAKLVVIPNRRQHASAVALKPQTEARWTGKVEFIPKLLDQPRRWKKPRRIFVNSMSDLFHPEVQNAWIWNIFSMMLDCPQHTFQILTKRPQRMLDVMRSMPIVKPNVWLGVSVEDQKTADERIRLLLRTPAAVRWVSYEPALGPVNFNDVPGSWKLNWIVCGGESGPGARPMHPDWARSVRNQCAAAGVPFFFKQWGEWEPADRAKPETWQTADRANSPRLASFSPQGLQMGSVGGWPPECQMMNRVGKKKAGRILDGRTHDEFPVAK